MNIEIRQDSSVNEFLDHAGKTLYRVEAVNSLMLGLCLRSLSTAPSTPTLCFRVAVGSETVSAALQTPPRNLVISPADFQQLSALANFLKQRDIQIPGVVGPTRESEQFAEIWRPQIQRSRWFTNLSRN